jgi:hypothetical protein
MIAIGPTDCVDAAAEQRVQQRRHDAGVQAHHRRQPGHQRIRHALRDHHHRHDQAGADVARQLGTPVLLQPLQHCRSTVLEILTVYVIHPDTAQL